MSHFNFKFMEKKLNFILYDRPSVDPDAVALINKVSVTARELSCALELLEQGQEIVICLAD